MVLLKTDKQTQNKRKDGKFAKGNTLGNRWKKGQSGNPNGRPKGSSSQAEQFRSNPRALEVINKVIKTANTLGTDDEHKDASSCAKIVVDKIIPTLKAQDISIETDGATGFVILPKEEPSVKEGNE